AFFNVACGGSRGGLYLLSDSNLDWGQDRPLLAKWQREHSNKKLYLAYIGLVDPAVYGIEYSPFPGSKAVEPTEYSGGPSYVAISASILQMTLFKTSAYRELNTVKPIAVLGGTTYIYNLWDTPALLNTLGNTLVNMRRNQEAAIALERAAQLQPN